MYLFRPSSQDAGTKLCRHKMNTVCNGSHDAGSMSVSSLFFSYLNFTLITVDNIYPSQIVSSNRNKTPMVPCSCTQRRDGKISLRFQTLITVSVTVSHFFMLVSCAP